MATHLHTGYNNHFMYLNCGQQTMPNGLVSRRGGGRPTSQMQVLSVQCVPRANTRAHLLQWGL